MTTAQYPSLPRDLSAPLRRVVLRQRVVRLARGLLQLLIVTSAVWLAVALLLGEFTRMPAVLRWPLAAIAWAAPLAAAVHGIKPALARRNLERAALQVEKALGNNDELITSAVELSNEPDERYRGSPELVKHLIGKAADKMHGVQPKAVISFKALRRWIMLLMPLLLLWGVLTPLLPAPIERGLWRMLRPWEAVLPAELCEIYVTPGDARVPQGDALEIRATLAIRGVLDSSQSPRVMVQVKYPSGQTASFEADATGPRSFRALIDSVQQDFQYQVSTDNAESPWYAVTMRPRPAVADVEVRYSYPAYTHLPEKTDPRSDGSVDAVVGTNATIVVHSTMPLSAESSLVLAENSPAAQVIPLSPAGGTEYRASVLVGQSCNYRISLVNLEGLASLDKTPRPIVARPDQPPTVKIVSPPVSISVRPDDTVPVLYHAEDDFGISKLEAIAQVDARPPQTIQLPLTGREPTKLKGTWKIDIAALLKQQQVVVAQHVYYQLKVTDNRDPNPQVALSDKHVLRLDHSYPKTWQARQEAQVAQDLIEAIKTAIDRLGAAQTQVAPLGQVQATRVYSAQERSAAGDAKNQLVKIGKDLDDAAQANEQGAYAGMARAAEAVAEGPIRGAAESMGSAQLNGDRADDRNKSVASAVDNVAKAKKTLEDLLKNLQERSRQQELARELADMAHSQEELAKAMQDHPKQPWQVQQQQRVLHQQLEKLIEKHPELRNENARQAAEKLEQLVRKVEQLEKDQKQTEETGAKQAAVDAAQEKVNELAQKQKELNKEIADFAKEKADPLKDAHVQPPQADRMDAIAKQLDRGENMPAAEQQQRAASEMKAQADQLKRDGANRNETETQRDQHRANEAQKIADRAAEKVAKLKAAEQEHPNKAGPQAQAKSQEAAQRAAQQVASLAQEMAQKHPDQKNAAEAAKKKAEQAQQDAQKGDAAKAAQEAAEAAKDLANAMEQAAKSDQQKHDAEAAAGEKESQLAQKQKELADKTAQAARAVEEAKRDRDHHAPLQQQAEQAASQTQQASAEAKQLQEQSQTNAPDISERAAEAQHDIDKAAEHDRAAAQAAKDKNTAKAQAEQKEAQKELAKAEKTLRGEQDQQDQASNDQNNQNAKGNQNDQPHGDQNPQEAKNDQGQKPQDGQKPQQGNQQDGQKGQQAKNDQGQKPQDGQKPQQGNQQGDQNSQQAKNDQGQNSQDGQKGQQANQQGGQKPQQQGKNGQQKPDKNAQATPEQLKQQAAEGVQEARFAQDEAQSGQAPAAAEQAAKALEKASEAVARLEQGQGQGQDQGQQQDPAQADAGDQNNGNDAGQQMAQNGADANANADANAQQSQAQKGKDGQGQDGQGKDGQGQDQASADANSAQAHKPSRNPHGQTKNPQGIDITGVHGAKAVPVEVREMGISASEWAKLPPGMQQQILNAAQQAGPPEYQEMIKNYYVRIARIQSHAKPEAQR